MSEDVALVGYAEGMQAQLQNASIGAGNPRMHQSDAVHNAPNREAASNGHTGAKDRRCARNRPSSPKSRLGGGATWYDLLLGV